MSRKPSRKVIVAVAAATLGGLGAVGCAEATATAAPHAAPAGAAHRDRAVHMTTYTNNDGPTEPVVVTGAVGDYGQAVSVHPDGSIDPEHDSELSLQLSHGSFRLDIAALDKAFVAAMSREFPTDTTTCSGHVAVTQRVPVVPGSGAGAYKGITGEFTLSVALDEVDKVTASQPCNGSAAFLSQVIVISGQGSVTLQ